jgi:hypothetical protein
MLLYNIGYTELKGGTNMDCGECKYFDIDDGNIFEGICRLVPPVWTGNSFSYPVVKRLVVFKDGKETSKDWCGQFVETEE